MFFVEIDIVLVEVILRPELSGGQRRVDHRDHVVFENFSRSQAGNGDVLLPIVGVDRSFALDRGAQILHRIVAGLHDAAVFFEHPDIRNFDTLVGGVVARPASCPHCCTPASLCTRMRAIVSLRPVPSASKR